MSRAKRCVTKGLGRVTVCNSGHSAVAGALPIGDDRAMSAETPDILIVDDDPEIRTLVAAFL